MPLFAQRILFAICATWRRVDSILWWHTDPLRKGITHKPLLARICWFGSHLSRDKFIVGCWKGSFKQCRNSSTGIRFLLLAVNTKRRRTRIPRSGKNYIFICAGAWSLEVKDGRRKSCDLVQYDLRCFLLRPLWHCDARAEWWLRLSLVCWAHSSPSVIAWIQPSSQSATITYQLPAE